MDYKTLITTKTYDFDMSEDEQAFCVRWETAHMLPLIRQLRMRGRADVYISACLNDMAQEGMICDDAEIADAAGISDDDWYRAENAQYRDNELERMYEHEVVTKLLGTCQMQ